MKIKIVLFFFALIVIFSCDKENSVVEDTTIVVKQDSVEKVDSLVKDTIVVVKQDTINIQDYNLDARELYYREVYNDSTHFNYNNYLLDTTEINKIFKLIDAIFKLKIPERDSVFIKHKIHSRFCVSYQTLNLKVKTNLPEIQNLVNNVIPTGNENLDYLLKKYNFDSVRTIFNYPEFPWLTIYTPSVYNMLPIQKEFRKLPFVAYAEMNMWCFDGNNITLKRDKESATITFSIGSGDCPAGCIHHKYWEFRVKSDIAEFIRTYER